ncbi:hypothetical protein BCR34DRAFT_80799 [Clohesyomyces aquaticus]|uniref:Uncharacterized protein n=1 Tax=Clohesyomyces aquaticus TaxID=1231657 RepID=A0A1Y1YWP5_9PLEO|nr:hypothetical protein BCR34DRAFT_80799 [Clohesyomyces aquaticus]
MSQGKAERRSSHPILSEGKKVSNDFRGLDATPKSPSEYNLSTKPLLVQYSSGNQTRTPRHTKAISNPQYAASFQMNPVRSSLWSLGSCYSWRNSSQFCRCKSLSETASTTILPSISTTDFVLSILKKNSVDPHQSPSVLRKRQYCIGAYLKTCIANSGLTMCMATTEMCCQFFAANCNDFPFTYPMTHPYCCQRSYVTECGVDETCGMLDQSNYPTSSPIARYTVTLPSIPTSTGTNPGGVIIQPAWRLHCGNREYQP